MTLYHPNPSQETSDLMTLAKWMAGDFSNYLQAAAEPQKFAHIHIFFRPLPIDFFAGIGFYSEQVYDYDLWTPYRQGVHKLIDRGDYIYIENYSLQDAIRFAGSARDLRIMGTITHDVVERRHHCGMVFERDGDMFKGSVEAGNQCLVCRNGQQTYLVSEVELTEKTWNSLDRGLDIETHQQVWGSQNGALKFEKRESFADEVPRLDELCQRN